MMLRLIVAQNLLIILITLTLWYIIIAGDSDWLMVSRSMTNLKSNLLNRRLSRCLLLLLKETLMARHILIALHMLKNFQESIHINSSLGESGIISRRKHQRHLPTQLSRWTVTLRNYLRTKNKKYGRQSSKRDYRFA